MGLRAMFPHFLMQILRILEVIHVGSWILKAAEAAAIYCSISFSWQRIMKTQLYKGILWKTACCTFQFWVALNKALQTWVKKFKGILNKLIGYTGNKKNIFIACSLHISPPSVILREFIWCMSLIKVNLHINSWRWLEKVKTCRE
jgi:hypothetical protein